VLADAAAPATGAAVALAADAGRAAEYGRMAAGVFEAYLEVQNVTSRDNPEEIVYANDYTRKDYLTGLPILPIAGARWSL
jgi:hypothetical protein